MNLAGVSINWIRAQSESFLLKGAQRVQNICIQEIHKIYLILQISLYISQQKKFEQNRKNEINENKIQWNKNFYDI